MYTQDLAGLTQVLQASISPVALISGVGLLILSETNRFTRITDRLRELATEREAHPARPAVLTEQINIFLQRARIMRLAIGAGILCVLLASLMVLMVFVLAVLGVGAEALVLLLFALSLLCLIFSLIMFLWDMHLSLKAAEKLLEPGRD